MRGLRSWAALTVAGVLAAACGGGSSDGEEVRIRPAEVRRFLEQDLNEGAQTPVDVTGVRCPRTTTEGDTARATCEVTIDGTAVDLAVERTGGRFARTEAVVVVPSLETFVAAQYDARLGLAVLVDCGEAELLPVVPGETIACTATDGQGATLAPVVVVEDLAGKVSVTLT
ncbi:MAG TPA: hypothetical protein VF152_13375 [Acidimicrobiia bacterium]